VKNIRTHVITNLRSARLMLLALSFTSLSIAGQAAAIDKNFFAGNDILFYDPSCAYSSSSTTLDGNGIKEKIWNFLIQNGLNDIQAAGIMGNMQAESGFVPTRHQSGGNNVYANGGSGNAWGLVQWDGGRRYTAPDKGVLGKLKKDKSELVKYADIQYDWARNKGAQAKIPPTDLDAILSFELNYLLQESKSRPVTAHGYGDAGNEWNTMKLQKNIEDSTVFWHNNFEVSADSASQVISTRGGFAKDIYKQFAGKTTTSSGSSSSSSGSSSSSSSGSATAPTVFIDPGHGGAIAPYIDQQSGLKTSESHNMPETADVLDVANQVKTALEGAGYKVIMARTTNDQQVKFRDRSNAAASASASIGVSIHTTPGAVNEVWPQRVGTYRQYGGKKETFTEKDTAAKSETFANIMAKTRTAEENHTVTTDPGNVTENGSFHRPGIDSTGNTPLVELWSPKVPWVYNEIGQDKGTAISDGLKKKYADGITKGIEEAIPFTKTDQCGNTAAVNGTLSNYVLAYAYHEYKPAPNWDLKVEGNGSIPGYAAAVKTAQKEGRYVGGGAHPGVDCGGFVTTLLYDSGFEPKYNSSAKGGNVVAQHAWADKNWKKLGSGSSIDVATLQPGDVAYTSDDGHTFVYVGKIEGFGSKIASASFSNTGESWRAPMAGHESPTGSVTWYRKK
jgi:N-acetylmuramoyl-L-alanine amidase